MIKLFLKSQKNQKKKTFPEVKMTYLYIKGLQSASKMCYNESTSNKKLFFVEYRYLS